uniref:NADH dehydrogenase subunit 6 n=1 Tax=Prionospio sp. 3 MH-2023 TaxID=3059271 RepID=A0AAU6QGC9_9ANNE
MTTLFFLCSIIAISSTLTLAASPLFLGLWVMLLALMMAMNISMSATSWLGLMMFLIYVGGLLVMFAYFVALTPNLLIEGKTMMYTLMLTTPLLFMILLTTSIMDNKTFSNISQFPMSYLMSENMASVTLIALTLFFALIAVVKMCSTFSAPLRPFN